MTKSTDFSYDVRGNVLTVTDAPTKTSTYTYDLFGRPQTSKVPKDQNANLFISTPAPEYDGNDNVTQATAPNGAISSHIDDDADQLISSKAPKDLATGPERETKYEYGNVVSVIDPRKSKSTDPADFTN